MKFISIIGAIMALSGCISTGKVDTEALKYSAWQLQSINGQNITQLQSDAGLGEKPIDIRFIDALQVNGFAGCNRFFGEGEIVEGQLKVKNLGMTRKYCGEEIAQVESQLINQLQIGVLLEVNANKLTLKGKPQFSFIKQ
ncbi:MULTISPECIES: META domain-containing protein [Pseudoalteromonas]|uniref:META domain-containing protein n=2 Tax=Pseudoalteromonas TaxID=53246 RepID=A0A8I2KSB0_9GAMM|nr:MULTISPECIES: META domain-containing protein [Pseudoalteromonas]KID36011.1 heat-shock protein [Pseudoalteromonas flavipulchra NCIMB 2033 = ATCC BAA-314]KJY94396.1 heat-shock protein [Pseudoalteromonas piscicida]MBD0780178.1 META domain-containing protein [Pseudoalteromonas flavipulchra]MCG9767401.1 META domain-containing protein [Pseudoalteromonas piscicida]MCO7199785.1 META domain-containing protein [Pseudoalteromonas sp. OANN1]|tara:strand:- start:270 stop:689 length:420 start_codon:yes stop_codon:yes gene_type:complete